MLRWCRWTLRTAWRLRTDPVGAWATIAHVARARQQHAATLAAWKAERPTWWADPGLAAEVGAQFAMHDCVEWYEANGQRLCVEPIEPPPAPAPVEEPARPTITALSAGEIWAVRGALAEVEGLGTFRKIRGD